MWPASPLGLQRWKEPDQVVVQVKAQEAPCWYSCLTKESWKAALLAQAKARRVDTDKEQQEKHQQIENMKVAMEMVKNEQIENMKSAMELVLSSRKVCACSKETSLL